MSFLDARAADGHARKCAQVVCHYVRRKKRTIVRLPEVFKSYYELTERKPTVRVLIHCTGYEIFFEYDNCSGCTHKKNNVRPMQKKKKGFSETC